MRNERRLGIFVRQKRQVMSGIMKRKEQSLENVVQNVVLNKTFFTTPEFDSPKSSSPIKFSNPPFSLSNPKILKAICAPIQLQNSLSIDHLHATLLYANFMAICGIALLFMKFNFIVLQWAILGRGDKSGGFLGLG